MSDGFPAAASETTAELPYGFVYRAKSIVWIDHADPEKPPLTVCGALRAIARTHDGRGHDWGVLLGWIDPEGNEHQWAMPRAMLAGDGTELRAMLLSCGLFVAPGRKAREKLAELLLTWNPPGLVHVTRRLGWHGSSFVLPEPDPALAPGLVLQTERLDVLPPLRESGTLAEWQSEVAAPAIGNSRLILALCAAVAAPLLDLVGAEGGGVHLRGGSSTGKTTAAWVAASVWGGSADDRVRWVRSWRATANALEAVAAAHSDLLLVLDEIGEATGETVGEAAYMLANGSGKGRANRAGGLRAPSTWRVLFLSTGETGLAAQMAETRGGPRHLRAGQEMRVLDVPAEAGPLGLFERLPDGCANPADFADGLRHAAKRVYGTAGRQWLRHLIKERAAIAAEARGLIEAFVATVLPAEACGQARRAASRFAVLAAAGELAARAGILPWPEGEAARGVGRCFAAWLAARDGGAGAAEDAAALAAVRRFLEAHGEARFTPLLKCADGGDAEPEKATINRAGWRRRDADGNWVFYILPETWRAEVCAGLDPHHVARALARAGHLTPGEGKNLAARIRVPGVGIARAYVIRASILGA